MKDPRLHAIQYCADEIVSFAQNFEDGLFYRAFKGKRGGTYFDIGAGHPIADSVTFWLNKMGWTGVNVEPNPVYFAELQRYRPKDINLNIGIADRAGELLFYQVLQNEIGHGWGLSSFNPEVEKLAARLNLKVQRLQVPVKTLREVVEDLSLTQIDVLKIDVEGFEATILSTTDWYRFRPKLICVEAVEPASSRPTWPMWEHYLVDADYRFALFDGVNSYYASADESEILGQLSAGVNCNDRWRRPTNDEFNCAPPP